MCICICICICICARTGEVFAWGCPDDGALGLGAREHAQLPRFVGSSVEFGARAVQAAAGFHHACVVTEDGALCTWGRGASGQLGRRCDQASERRPTRLVQDVFAGAAVLQVACGWNHTIVVSSEGLVFTCGSNEHGQLGHGDTEAACAFARIHPASFGGARIVVAAGGATHSVVACSKGLVFTWGCGAAGRLGHGNETDRLAPAVLQSELLGPAARISAGGGHNVAVSKHGSLVVWGWGSYGQLGVGDTSNRLEPTRIDTDKIFGAKVLTAACGYIHTLAVTQNGALWAWGYGEKGVLGLGMTKSRRLPMRVDPKHFGHSKIVDAGGGYAHSMALTETGTLFTWGRYSDHKFLPPVSRHCIRVRC